MRWVGVLVALLLIGGCGSVGGEPVAPAPAEPTELVLPPRPRDLRIDGVEPCSLLTEQQRVELGLEQRADKFVDNSRLFGGPVPSCLFRGQSPRAVSVGIGVAKARLDDLKRINLDADLRELDVARFPAMVAVPRAASDYCSVDVEVASGHVLDVVYGDTGLPPPIEQEDLCRRAIVVADRVVMTLSLR